MSKDWTGERLETFVWGESTAEHLHRYALAMDHVRDKDVLDIACGDGYGSALLNKTARSVIGVDVNKDVIDKACKKYISASLTFKQGSATNIPLDDQSVDVVVSFETLEHLEDHDGMMKEIKRVLKPGGLLIISTPNKAEYSEPVKKKIHFISKN